MCGDPECRRCFPRGEERDFGDLADEGYERRRQEELDDKETEQ